MKPNKRYGRRALAATAVALGSTAALVAAGSAWYAKKSNKEVVVPDSIPKNFGKLFHGSELEVFVTMYLMNCSSAVIRSLSKVSEHGLPTSRGVLEHVTSVEIDAITDLRDNYLADKNDNQTQVYMNYLQHFDTNVIEFMRDQGFEYVIFPNKNKVNRIPKHAYNTYVMLRKQGYVMNVPEKLTVDITRFDIFGDTPFADDNRCVFVALKLLNCNEREFKFYKDQRNVVTTAKSVNKFSHFDVIEKWRDANKFEPVKKKFDVEMKLFFEHHDITAIPINRIVYGYYTWKNKEHTVPKLWL